MVSLKFLSISKDTSSMTFSLVIIIPHSENGRRSVVGIVVAPEIQLILKVCPSVDADDSWILRAFLLPWSFLSNTIFFYLSWVYILLDCLTFTLTVLVGSEDFSGIGPCADRPMF